MKILRLSYQEMVWRPSASRRHCPTVVEPVKRVLGPGAGVPPTRADGEDACRPRLAVFRFRVYLLDSRRAVSHSSISSLPGGLPVEIDPYRSNKDIILLPIDGKRRWRCEDGENDAYLRLRQLPARRLQLLGLLAARPSWQGADKHF